MTPVLQRTNLLTVALLEDYKNHSIRSYKRTIIKDGDSTVTTRSPSKKSRRARLTIPTRSKRDANTTRSSWSATSAVSMLSLTKRLVMCTNPQVGSLLPSMCATTSLTATVAMSALSGQTGQVGTSTWTEVPCRRF